MRLAERRAGELLSKVERQQGKRDGGSALRATLDQSDIAPTQAKRWQAIATVPEAEIRKLEAQRELTSAGYRHRAPRVPETEQPGGGEDVRGVARDGSASAARPGVNR